MWHAVLRHTHPFRRSATDLLEVICSVASLPTGRYMNGAPTGTSRQSNHFMRAEGTL
jgi:hypothetical protein